MFVKIQNPEHGTRGPKHDTQATRSTASPYTPRCRHPKPVIRRNLNSWTRNPKDARRNTSDQHYLSLYSKVHPETRNQKFVEIR